MLLLQIHSINPYCAFSYGVLFCCFRCYKDKKVSRIKQWSENVFLLKKLYGTILLLQVYPKNVCCGFNFCLWICSCWKDKNSQLFWRIKRHALITGWLNIQTFWYPKFFTSRYRIMPTYLDTRYQDCLYIWTWFDIRTLNIRNFEYRVL